MTKAMSKTPSKLQLCDSPAIEEDVRRQTLKVLLCGHDEPMFFDISADVSDRLFEAVQGESPDIAESSFVVFDSGRLRVALNLRATMFCHFLWDVDIGTVTFEDTDPERAGDQFNAVLVYFGTSPTPISINVDVEDPSDMGGEHNYLNEIFYGLDSGDAKPHQRLHIFDEDAESAFLRVSDVVLLTCPLWVVDPRLAAGNEEEG